MVNLDGYKIISDSYGTSNWHVHRMKRKNMNMTNPCIIKGKEDMIESGIDLNRNYSYKFAYDNIGSNLDPCDEIYRGKYPFSEPETRAIKELVENNKVSTFINLHSYGNLWLEPFSYKNTMEEVR